MSRPGAKKRGRKSTGPGPHRAPGGAAKNPQHPFPRSRTVPITGPAFRRGDTLADANTAWFTYLRIVARLEQMKLPPGHKFLDR